MDDNEKRRENEKSDAAYISNNKLWSKSETRLWTINFFMGTCVLYASRVALPICATIMAQEFGWHKSDSGTVMSCFFWGYAITQVIAGSIADEKGGERVLTVTTLIWSALTFFTPQLFDFAYWSGYPLPILLIVRILTGVGQGFHLPSMASMVSRHLTSADKGRVFGISLAGSHFGSVVAGAIGSILLEWFGWRSLFQFVGLISFIWYLFFKKLKEETLLRRRNIVSDSISSLPLINEKKKEPDNVFMDQKSSPVPWKQLFSHPAFWAASCAQYCGANAYFTMFSWLPSYFSDNFPNAKGVVYNVVPSLAIVVTSLMAPFLASRLLSNGKSVTFTRRFMESASLVAMAFCLILVSMSSGSFYMSLFIFTMAMAGRGIFNAFSAVTGFIGVYVAGWILQSTGNNWSYVFLFTSFQCIFGAIIYSLFGTGNKII